MQYQTNYCRSNSKSISPNINETANRRHYRSPSSCQTNDEKILTKATPSSSTSINKPHKEIVAKLTRKVYNVNIDNGVTENKKIPKLIRRMIDDPQQIGVVRRFGEGATPIFEREELLKKDESRTQNSRANSSSRESLHERRRSLSPNTGSNRSRQYDKNKLEKSESSSTRQSRSRERRLYNKDKKKKSTPSPRSKTSYFLDTKREEDRIRRKYGEKKRVDSKTHSRSRSRDRNRKHSRRRSRSRSRTRSRSRSSQHSMMAIHPYPIAYYPPPYPYPAPYVPIDPLWRPYPPYPFPPRLPFPPHYLPHGPRHGIPGPSGALPYIQNFRPRLYRR